jgi:hypothetical protein
MTTTLKQTVFGDLSVLLHKIVCEVPNLPGGSHGLER